VAGRGTVTGKGEKMSSRKLDGEGKERGKSEKLLHMPAKTDAPRSGEKPAASGEDNGAIAGPYKGAEKTLREAVKARVRKESSEIARTLVEHVKKGDMHGAEVVLSLLHKAKEEDDAKKKKRSGPNWAELLASEPEWDESMEARGQGTGTAGLRE